MERLRRSLLTHTDPRWVDAPREPISLTAAIATLFASFGTAAVAAGAVETTAAVAAGAGLLGSFGTSLLIGGVLTGLNFALAKTQPNLGDVGLAANTASTRGSIREAVAPQQIVYGRIIKGGAWMFYDDATAPYQYLMLALMRGKVSAIRAVWINNNRVTFDSLVNNTVVNPFQVEGQDYFGNLIACFRDGDKDQAKDALLDAHFPASGSDFVFDDSGQNIVNLPSTFRQRGVATASFRASFAADADANLARWGNVPFINPLVELDGLAVYDPRDPTQILPSDPDDPDSVAEAEATWKFTREGKDVGRTPALCQAHWLIQKYGGRIRPDKLRLDELAACAEWDEGMVHDKAGNARQRHLCDGVVSLNANPRDVTEALLTSNNALLVDSRGRIGWTPAVASDPVITLTEDDLLGGFDFQFGQRKKDTFNRVRTRFVPPEKNNVEDDGPIIDRSDLRSSEDDGEILDTTVTVPFTSDERGVQWLAAQFLEQSRLPRSLTIPALRISPRIARRKIGEVIRVEFRRYPDVNATYQIRQDGFDSQFSSVTWSLREFDPAILSKDRSADEMDFQVAEAA